jgi:hypothetical protein
VVTMPTGKKYIASEWRSFYLRDVKHHIDEKRKRREKEYNSELTRIS